MARTFDKGGDLDNALDDPMTLILMIRGSTGTIAESLYEEAVETATEPWRRVFLIDDLSLLKPMENTLWFDGSNNRYCVLRKDTHEVCKKGEFDDLLTQGKPSSRKIDKAFNQCE